MNSSRGAPGSPLGRDLSLESKWDSNPAVDEKMRTLSRRTTFRTLRNALGLVGALSVIAGTLVMLGTLGFLVFLWSGEGAHEGKGAMPTWRKILLEGWITQAITLASVVLRVVNAAQASVCTGLIAALILESIPLKHLAEFSLIRSANDGPLRLTWLMYSSIRKMPIAKTLLLSILLLGSFAVQFTSTILVSDLSVSTLVGDARNESRGILPTDKSLVQYHLSNQYSLKPIFVPFAEVPGTDSSPNDAGVSDTGIVGRIHPFIPQANRTTTREYRGKALKLSTRMVCMRPVIDNLVLDTIPYSNPTYAQSFLPYLSGSISYNASFRNAAKEFPENCRNGKCFPSAFNCSIGVRTGQPGRPALTGCIPSGRNAFIHKYHNSIEGEPIARTSEVFLIVSSNVLFDTPFNNTATNVPRNVTVGEEWTNYSFNQGVLLSASLCFQRLAYDMVTVDLQTDQDLEDGVVHFDGNSTTWETGKVTRYFGSPDYGPTKTPAQRGIYAVNSISTPEKAPLTQRLEWVMVSDTYSSVDQGNISIGLSPYGGGNLVVFPHVEYQAIFADVLRDTNRPGLALQNLVTALSGSIFDSLIPQFEVMDNIETVPSVSILAPRRQIGLISVILIHALNIICVIVIVSLYLVGTECTSQGNYWHAVSQIVSDVSLGVIHHSTQATDGEVATALKDHDVNVKIAKSGLSGRVHAVRCDSWDADR